MSVLGKDCRFRENLFMNYCQSRRISEQNPPTSCKMFSHIPDILQLTEEYVIYKRLAQTYNSERLQKQRVSFSRKSAQRKVYLHLNVLFYRRMYVSAIAFHLKTKFL